jgi:acetyl esterase/lipase
MSHHRLAVCALSILLTCACLNGVNAAAPPARVRPALEVPSEVRYVPNLCYGKGGKEDLLLDLAQPRHGRGPFPAVLVLHGGAWTKGSRKSALPVIFELARLGCVAVTASYRFAPRHRYPAQIHDAKCAVRWLRANAGHYRIDPQRITALGFSSGGHLACLLGTTAGRAELEGTGGHAEHSSKVQLVVGYYPVTDLQALRITFLHGLIIDRLMGKASATDHAHASPITHADRRSAPTLLLHGTADLVVPFSQSRALADKLQKSGVHVQLHTLKEAGHNFDDLEADRIAREFIVQHFKLKVALAAPVAPELAGATSSSR